MPFVFDIQSWILTVALLALLAIEAWAFVDAISHKPEVYEAAGKQNKKMWLVILGIALAALFLTTSLNILTLAGAIAALVYLLDVRPALRSLTSS